MRLRFILFSDINDIGSSFNSFIHFCILGLLFLQLFFHQFVRLFKLVFRLHQFVLIFERLTFSRQKLFQFSLVMLFTILSNFQPVGIIFTRNHILYNVFNSIS